MPTMNLVSLSTHTHTHNTLSFTTSSQRGEIKTFQKSKTTNTTKLKKMNRSAQRVGKEIMSLNEFLQRSKVLVLYRQMMRTARKIDDGNELAEQIRRNFKDHANESDRNKIRTYMAHGLMQLKQLDSMSITLGSDVHEEQQPSTSSLSSSSQVGQEWPWER